MSRKMADDAITLSSIVRLGHLEIFKFMVEREVDPSKKTFYDSILLAAEHGRVDFLKYFNQLDIDFNVVDEQRNTPLHIAIINREVKVAKFLIKHGANINKINFQGNSPLHMSVKFGLTGISDLLIARGAKINVRNFSGWTPLHFAAYFDHLKSLKKLCKAGADHTFTGKCRHYSPFHLAANTGNIKMITYFLSKGADINFQTDNGYTILHAAIRSNNFELAVFLIKNGAKINSRTLTKNYSALDFASIQGNCRSINLLIQNGADFDVKPNGQCRLLDLLFNNFPNYYTEHNKKDYILSAGLIIKFLALRNRYAPPSIPQTFPFSKELREFWNDCKWELEQMDSQYIGDSTISKYRLLRALFDDNELAKYLNNEEVSMFTEKVTTHIDVSPIYNNIADLVITGIRKGRQRNRLLCEAHSIIGKITGELPLEIITKISDRLDMNDLKSLTRLDVKCATLSIKNMK